MRISPRIVTAGAISALAMATAARADVFNLPAGETNLQFVPVGDPGNAPDANRLGSVAYSFQMGTYDITVSQYCDMLNAVAASDPYGLYNPSMNPGNGFGSPGITQLGSQGSFTYTVASGYANFPVNNVSWGDAARFCNWLANGQPSTGVENASTTEDGSYSLNGALTDQQLNLVTRSPSAVYVIPTENEWYKSSYYKGGSANAGYWLFPTQSNTPPSNILSVTGNNNANFEDPVLGFSDPTTGISPVGSFSGSPGPWGTFDMGGDVAQWTETVLDGGRVFLGGSYASSYEALESTSSDSTGASQYGNVLGFRVAEVPEPSSTVLLAGAAIGLLRRRRAQR